MYTLTNLEKKNYIYVIQSVFFFFKYSYSNAQKMQQSCCASDNIDVSIWRVV